MGARVGRPRAEAGPPVFIAFDGEGEGRAPHRYVELSLVHEDGTLVAHAANPEGLTTWECLELVTTAEHDSRPVRRLFGYATGYDLAMMLRDLKDRDIYRLMHDDPLTGRMNWIRVERPRLCAYVLGYRGRSLTVSRIPYDRILGDWAPCARRTVHLEDVFKFFQSAAVVAYRDWEVYRDPKYAPVSAELAASGEPAHASPEKTILAFLGRMKDDRERFADLAPSIKRTYNRVETQGYADLARKIHDACAEAGFPIARWDGAGSIAKSILKNLNVQACLPEKGTGGYPAELGHAWRCAQFGGHFEISRRGPIKGPVREADIASAYPYQLWRQPCLRCGRWRRVAGKRAEAAVRAATLACCRVSWCTKRSWGPLPLRLSDGSTIWPLASDGGTWVWRDEYDAAVRSGADVRLREAWVYETSCSHRPFERLSELYRRRLEWGKTGRGIALKLGMNAIYGTTVQNVGSTKFRSIVWGGNVTAGTRAMLTDAISLVGEDRTVMVATDALYYTGRRRRLAEPEDTGTTLGAWETDDLDELFVIRPGIYFEPSGKKLRSRGFRKSVLSANMQKIREAWDRSGPDEPVSVSERRFVGLKAGVLCSSKGFSRRDAFAEWGDFDMRVSYEARPKRMGALSQTELAAWLASPEGIAKESAPYDKRRSDASPEGRKLEERREWAHDQPDGDFDPSEAP